MNNNMLLSQRRTSTRLKQLLQPDQTPTTPAINLFSTSSSFSSNSDNAAQEDKYINNSTTNNKRKRNDTSSSSSTPSTNITATPRRRSVRSSSSQADTDIDTTRTTTMTTSTPIRIDSTESTASVTSTKKSKRSRSNIVTPDSMIRINDNSKKNKRGKVDSYNGKNKKKLFDKEKKEGMVEDNFPAIPSPSTTTRTSSSPPVGWEDTYRLVEELRADKTAPCDIDGCEALVDRTKPLANQRFQILIALMLSSQTKDNVVGNAIRSMQKDNVLDIHSIYNMSHEQLNLYISKVGFHNIKTKHIKTVASILHEQYNDDIPHTASEMIKNLPGVGPKMAYICESAAWNTSTGIGVDTHMHRLFSKKHLNWVHNKNCTTPEQTRIIIESWLPSTKWNTFNLLFVGFGQEIQQQKLKLIKKVVYNCSRPYDGLQLLQQCGLDYKAECKKVTTHSSSSSSGSTSSSNDKENERTVLETEIHRILLMGNNRTHVTPSPKTRKRTEIESSELIEL